MLEWVAISSSNTITGINLKDPVLKKKASPKRTNAKRCYLYEVPTIIKFLEIENRMVVAWVQGEGGRNRDFCLMGMWFQFGKMKKF